MAHWTTFVTEDALRDALVAHGRSFVGVRWRHRGRTREHGVDCLGLLISCAQDFGFSFDLYDDDAQYSMDPSGYMLVDRLSTEMIRLDSWREAKAGDVVLMRWRNDIPPQHVGLVTANSPADIVCIHASRATRRVVETRWDRPDLITHGFRIKELANG